MFGQILWKFVKRELKVRYSGSILGPVWIVLYPLAFTAVATIVFSMIFNSKVGTIPYILYVLVGTIVWVYFSSGIINATRSLVANREIVANVNFDWSTIVIGSIVVRLTDLLVNFIFFVGLFCFLGQVVTINWLLLPFILAIQTLLLVGIGLILATLNVYYRDIQSLVEILLQILYFMSPIIYPLSIVPSNIRWIIKMNPITNIIELYRGIVFGGGINGYDILVLVAESLFMMSAGLVIFKSYKYKFPELI